MDVTKLVLSLLLVAGGAPLVWRTVRDAMRGHFATDIVASLAIVGAVLLGQPIAGLVIVLMQRGGEALERYAEGRASASVRKLEEAAPAVAHRIEGDRVVDVAANTVAIGDLLLVRPGDLIACDGVITDGTSEIDTSALTGEPVPLAAAPGVEVLSGMLNGRGALRMRATARAVDSQYARIVELVRSAQASKAPLQRLADRYAVWFTPLTLAVCVLTFVLTREWTRVLAVLVVATPCPLILATPIAIVGGINRAARRSIIVRNGTALERLSAVTVAVFDKTGTLTVGKPSLSRVHAAAGFDPDEVLLEAAAVEQGSSHLLARVVYDAAEQTGAPIPRATEHMESPGHGVSGRVNGREVRVGARPFVLERVESDAEELARIESTDVTLRSYVGIGDRFAGVIEYVDELRPDLPRVLSSLHGMGVGRTLLLSGDHSASARAVAERVGIKEVHGDLMPEDKERFIRRLTEAGDVVLMVGDGTNDAPALSSADVGIALAGHGGGVTTEAANVIVLVDALDRVSDSVAIGRRTIRIARQSIWVGLILSGGAMIAAAYGLIAPVVGAVFQEVIDVAVILNALRSARNG